MESASARPVDSALCLWAQLVHGHACTQGCGMIQDGGMDNISGDARERTAARWVVAEEGAASCARTVLRSLAADWEESQQEPIIGLTKEAVIGVFLCQRAYDRVRTTTEADLKLDRKERLGRKCMEAL
eukprot:SAG25_NODE_2191_length_1855_cov_1.302392_3_plen_127_part_01